MRAFAFGLFVLLATTAACGGGRPVQDADPAVAAAPTGTVPPNTEPGPAPVVETPVAKKRKPYEIANLCPNVVTLLFGDDPKAPNVGSTTVAGNGRIDEGPRDKDGNQIIWLMVRGDPLVKVHVSRGTKRIEIGTSCDTLEMH